jgi:hypothetical protein
MKATIYNIIIAILLLFPFAASAQNWKEVGGLNALAANGNIFSICNDISGNAYIGGDFYNSGFNQYVAKWDGTAWSELGGLNTLAADSTIWSICSDPGGNIYAAGEFTNPNDGEKHYCTKIIVK